MRPMINSPQVDLTNRDGDRATIHRKPITTLHPVKRDTTRTEQGLGVLAVVSIVAVVIVAFVLSI